MAIEGKHLGDAKFVTIAGKTPTEESLKALLGGKNVIVFALPGAFTPTCSGSHVPRYEELYDCFTKQCGIHEVYCLSVNDGFVMNAWFDKLGVKKVKIISDGNHQVAEAFGILVDKPELGFGKRCRRSAFYIKDGKVEKAFMEADKPGDPFEVSDADTMIKYLNPQVKLAHRIALFGLKSCHYCHKAETYMSEKGYQYNYIELTDGNKQSVMGAIHPGHKSTPMIIVDGEYIGGCDDFMKRF